MTCQLCNLKEKLKPLFEDAVITVIEHTPTSMLVILNSHTDSTSPKIELHARTILRMLGKKRFKSKRMIEDKLEQEHWNMVGKFEDRID